MMISTSLPLGQPRARVGRGWRVTDQLGVDTPIILPNADQPILAEAVLEVAGSLFLYLFSFLSQDLMP